MRLRLLLLAISPLLALASPVRSNMGGDELLRIDDSLPQNLWVWPDDVTAIKTSPSTVWIPEIGVWYASIAINGYSRYAAPAGEFSDHSVSSTFSAGYSLGTFLPLEEGHYVLKYTADGKSQFSLGFYREVDGGYINHSYSIFPTFAAGDVEQVFTVPTGISLVLLLPTSRNASAPPLTVTNIEIYRID